MKYLPECDAFEVNRVLPLGTTRVLLATQRAAPVRF
jgi:hypothetical protein